MKKILFSLLALSVVFVSCKKEEVSNPGSVTLDITDKTVNFGDVYKITPTISTTGDAASKTYTWTSNADSIASVKPISGGYGEVTAKRIGQATITFGSTDGVIKKTSSVTVNPKSTLLNGIQYKKGVDSTYIKNNYITSGFTQIKSGSKNFLIFENPASTTITKLIYELDANYLLKTAYVVLADNTANSASAEQYMKERYVNTGGLYKGSILLYENTGFTNYAFHTMFGLFYNMTLNNVQYPLGVVILDKSYTK